MEPAAISLLRPEAPIRFSELNARSGDPVHDRGNKPDAHQQPEEKHATDNTLTVCVIFGGEPANSANNQRAYYALTQYGKDNQWPLMPSISHFTLPPD